MGAAEVVADSVPAGSVAAESVTARAAGTLPMAVTVGIGALVAALLVPNVTVDKSDGNSGVSADGVRFGSRVTGGAHDRSASRIVKDMNTVFHSFLSRIKHQLQSPPLRRDYRKWKSNEWR